MTARPRLQQVERRAEEIRTPGRPWPDVRRLVIARDDRLGDVILTVPAVAALRRAYPEARLAMLVRRDVAPLARMVRGVDCVLEAEGGALAGRLREFGPDLLVCVSRGLTLAWAGARAGVARRVGPGRRFYSPLFHRCVGERRRSGERHELEYALSFAHRSGAAAGPAEFPLAVTDAERRRIEAWLASLGIEAPFVVLHPGSGGSCPAWPIRHHLGLASLLSAQGVRVVLSVGPGDETVRRAIVAAPEEVQRLPRFVGGVAGLAALLARAAVAVASSTGPVHLAAALGTATLAFHAPWQTCGPTRWGPYAANGWALVAGGDDVGAWTRGERRRRGEELMATIDPATAAACVLDLARGARPRVPA